MMDPYIDGVVPIPMSQDEQDFLSGNLRRIHAAYDDAVSKALRRAWQLGQTYWQQADSESYSQNAKADGTQAKFQALVDEIRAAVLVPPNA